MSYLCLNAKLILLPTLLHAELLGIQWTILYHDKYSVISVTLDIELHTRYLILIILE